MEPLLDFLSTVEIHLRLFDVDIALESIRIKPPIRLSRRIRPDSGTSIKI